MTLFRLGSFKLHSGGLSNWKIDMDRLDDEDVAVIAMLGSRMVGPFSSVVGIPRGGLRLAEAMTEYATERDEDDPVLVVDDVLTTGRSMEQKRAELEPELLYGAKVIGLVAFARGPLPPWVKAVFTYNGGD